MENNAQTKILLVEDDARLSALVKEYLESNQFVVAVEERGDCAAQRVKDEKPDLIILDIMLPGKDGLSVCQDVRTFYSGPILMLTALDGEPDEVVGLQIGADDYLTKPTSPRLLLTRIRALLRRSSASRGGAESLEKNRKIRIGALLIDPSNRQASLEGNALDLTTAEFDLLHLLARHTGQILPRERIYRELRNAKYDGMDRSIDLRIVRLRKKLNDDGKQPRRIISIRGTGYLLAEDQ